MCGGGEVMAAQRDLQVKVESEETGVDDKVAQLGLFVNPSALEFTPPMLEKSHPQTPYGIAYPVPQPVSPLTVFNVPIVTEFRSPPITYNAYIAPHIQMNCLLPIAPTPLPPPPTIWSSPEIPVMCNPVPIPVANTHLPCTNMISHTSPPFQPSFMVSPQISDGRQAYQSRSLLLSLVPTEFSDHQIHQELLVWGPIRALHLEAKHDGMVTVDFYDLRHANQALFDIRQQYMMLSKSLESGALQQPFSYCWRFMEGRLIWAQYAEPTAENQGTLVIFNVDTAISDDNILSIFQHYGAVKEVRGTPFNNRTKFVEFFDIRDAERTRNELDRKEIGSEQVKNHFSHSNGRTHKDSANFVHNIPPRHHRRPHSDHTDFSCDRGVFWSEIHKKSNTSRFANVTKRGRGRESGFGREGDAATNNWKRESTHAIGEETRSQFAFDETQPKLNGEETRTTVMIKNIPNQFDHDMLLKMLDSHCMLWNQCIQNADETRSAYDFVYLPIDFKNKCNLGYAFVNFTSATATWKLYKEFHGHHWAISNSKKICKVTYARLQGRSSLEEHFKKSSFECDTDDYLPLVFDPPRNGEVVTLAKVVGGRRQSESSINKEKPEYCGKNQNRFAADSRYSSSYCHNPAFDHTYQYRMRPSNHHRTNWQGQNDNFNYNKPKITTYYRPKNAAPAVDSDSKKVEG
ncbi:protein terminal ear1 homolog [Cryptomeria japonica]|uniref:protein terminal ear1 homolog n=1 Tax=Cryptomeria japonica TaxID=3369 RepID=UPI0027DA8131|nr:protein terminal ear1 homolog [Cryptomeria japonica]